MMDTPHTDYQKVQHHTKDARYAYCQTDDASMFSRTDCLSELDKQHQWTGSLKRDVNVDVTYYKLPRLKLEAADCSVSVPHYSGTNAASCGAVSLQDYRYASMQQHTVSTVRVAS